MTIDVQIAFQGGGARLALFYGAIQALQQLERDRVIRVTRVSGASAGAIAAAMFAGRANIPSLLMYHKSLDRELIAKAFPDLTKSGKLAEYFNTAKAAFFNSKVGDEAAFAKLLGGALQAAGVKAARIEQLDIPCFINTTNIVKHRTEYAAGDDSLIQALVDSAALPFLFRNGGEKIDGGILDNLPIDVLGTNHGILPEHGEIIAISFPPDPYSTQVESAVELAKRLLASAINSKVARAKQILGEENVLELPIEFDDKQFSTFSVDSYVSAATSNTIVDNIRYKTAEWFTDWVAARNARTSEVVVNSRQDAERLNLQQLRGLADSLHKNTDLHLVKTVLEVTACCLEESGKDDKLDFIDTFRVGDAPVFSYVTRMSVSSESTPGDTAVRVHDAEGKFLQTRQFVIADDTSDTFWTMVMLEKALEGGTDETFTVHSKQTSKGIMQPLLDAKSDYLAIQILQAKSADIAEIRLFVPKSVKLSTSNGTNTLLAALDIESYDEFGETALKEGEPIEPNAENTKSCPAGYHAYIWRGEKLKTGEAIRVVYRIAKR